MITIQASARELHTILAALRFLQSRPNEIERAVLEIATDGDTVERLAHDEIDALCERINIGAAECSPE